MLVFIPTLPRALRQKVPHRLRAGVGRNRVLTKQTTISNRAQEPCALVPAPSNGCFVTWKSFWMSWMGCPLLWGTESWKSFLCKWHGFIVRNQEWPHYCQKKLAQDELLQPPIVTVGRCPPTSSWLLFNNLWIAFTHVVTEGYIFVLSRLRDSPGGDTCLTLGVCGCSVRISLMPSWVICKMYFEKKLKLKLLWLNLMDLDIISWCGNRSRAVLLRITAFHRHPHKLSFGYSHMYSPRYSHKYSHRYYNRYSPRYYQSVPICIPTGSPTSIPTGKYIPTCIPTGTLTGISIGIPTGIPQNFLTGIPTCTLTGISVGISTGIPSSIPTSILRGIP